MRRLPMDDARYGIAGELDLDESWEKHANWRSCRERFAPFAAEFAGTFALTLVAGCCQMAGNPLWNAPAISGTYMAASYALAPVSGGHFNPAVSCACLFLGKLSWKATIGYLFVQICAGLLAGCAVFFIFLSPVPVGILAPFSGFCGGLVEVILTAAFCFVWVNVNCSLRSNPKKDGNQFFALATALALLGGVFATERITRGFLNPAVVLGLWSTSSGILQALWLIPAELVGAVVAALLFGVARPEEASMRLSEDSSLQELAFFTSPLHSCLVAEFTGTFFVIFAGGLALATQAAAPSIAAGAMVVSLMYAVGNISGGHFNPAVTFAVALGGRSRCEWRDGLCYVAMQTLAALISGLIVTYVHLSGNLSGHLLGLGPLAPYRWPAACAAEALFTLLLAYVFLAVATTRHPFPGSGPAPLKNYHFALAAGACMVTAGFAVGHISGGIVNPALALSLSLESIVTSINSEHDHAQALLSNIAMVSATTFNSTLGVNSSVTRTNGDESYRLFAHVYSPALGNVAVYWLSEFGGALVASLLFLLTHPHEYRKPRATFSESASLTAGPYFSYNTEAA